MASLTHVGERTIKNGFIEGKNWSAGSDVLYVGLESNRAKYVSKSCLQPDSDGLQPTSDGLQPKELFTSHLGPTLALWGRQ